MENKNTEQKIDIELPEELSNGIYSNLAIITHSNTEFITDFVQMMPGVPKGKVRSRVILHPYHAKRLMLALTENIRRYEEVFGDILLDENIPNFPLNFGGPTGEA